jgi:hypothetical protein
MVAQWVRIPQMLYDAAEEVAARLDDRFPREAVQLTRLPRDTEDEGPKAYRVEAELTTPLGADQLGSLLGIADEVEGAELSLDTSALGAGSTVTAVFE